MRKGDEMRLLPLDIEILCNKATVFGAHEISAYLVEGEAMSEETYALRRLREFILKRVDEFGRWTIPEGMSDELVDDSLFALKIRKDESRAILTEINRMLEFKPSGLAKKNQNSDK